MQLTSSLAIFKECSIHIEGQHAEIHKILTTFDLDIIFQFLRKMEFEDNDVIIYFSQEWLQFLFEEVGFTLQFYIKFVNANSHFLSSIKF
jgi:hypothetical protein